MPVKLARLLPLLALSLLAFSPAGGGGPRLRLKAPELSGALVEFYPPTSEPRDAVKRSVYERINRDRARAGLAPVLWDEGASRVADDFCAEQIAEKTRGHFLTDGVPPYARTGFAGIFGLQSENSVSWWTTAKAFSDPIEKLALYGHEDMMEEKPPSDGHRRTILDAEATHVGVGYAARGGRFQMAQEFLVRHLARLSLSLLGPEHAEVRFEGRPDSLRTLEFVTVAREEGPRMLSREEASGRTRYAYPAATLSYLPEREIGMRVVGTVSEHRLKVRSDGSFSFDFRPERAGLYTFVFYTASRATKHPRPGGSAVLWFE